jgi:replication factor C subunit 3/5
VLLPYLYISVYLSDLKVSIFPLFHTRLEDLVAQDDIVSILTNLIDSDNLPHLLLYGPPGTGKTSTIVAAAKRMYGGTAAYSSMTLELNASDARGIDVSSLCT